ncbi:MAG: glycoside hydrolase family 88 protein, partial [Oscillospiraceae bacterium]
MIRKITDRIVYGKDVDWAMNIEKFDWIPGVGLYGIFNAYRATGEEKYLEFLNEWANRHLQEAYTKKTINSTAPLLTIVELYDETNKEEYLKVCTDIANWIINEAPLTCEGGLEHTVTEVGDGFSQQIWADTLFMVCLFLVKLGKISKQQKYINFDYFY